MTRSERWLAAFSRRWNQVDLAVGDRLDAEPTRPPCGYCVRLLTWSCARRPDGLVRRIGLLLDLVEAGAFEETTEGGSWHAVDRGRIDAELMLAGTPDLPAELAVRCLSPRCGRTYALRWTYGRGRETWTVTVR